jgi:putative phosphoribosyl transferase
MSLDVELTVPHDARGLVLVSPGDLSPHDARARLIIGVFDVARLATIVLHPALAQDAVTSSHDRVIAAVDWSRTHPQTSALPIGLFGVGRDAAAALMAVAARPVVRAVVSYGGCPDAAGAALGQVVVPAMLIVGGHDDPAMAANRHAFARFAGARELQIVPGARVLSEEPGALEDVAHLACDWFLHHFPQGRAGLR